MAYILTHTPEQLKKWQEIVVSDPARAVRIIGMVNPERPTREGDTHVDVHAAMTAIAEASRRDTEPEGYDGTQWEPLVKAGVVEQICKVIPLRQRGEIVPVKGEIPADLLEATKLDLPTPYQLCLEILGNALTFTTDTSSSASKRIVLALKRNWSAITRRVWDEPFNSLLPTDTHVLARVVYSQICLFMIALDPSILEIIYSPNNMTIPIVARYWKHSTLDIDTKINTQLIWWFLLPQHPVHQRYVQEHGPPNMSTLLSSLYLGVSPKPTSSVQARAAALVSAAAKHLSRSKDVERNFLLALLLALREVAEKAEDTVLESALRKSGALWSECMTILRTVPDEPAGLDIVSTLNALGLMMNVVHRAEFDSPMERQILLKLWIEQGLLDLIEKKIEILAMMKGAHMQLSRLAICIDKTASESPQLMLLLRNQFPRWRLQGILMRVDIARRASGQGELTEKDARNMAIDSPIWILLAWQAWSGVQNTCFDFAKCARRSCGKPGEIKCECGVALYCSEVCQKKDLDYHQIACQFLPLLMKGGEDVRTQPEASTSISSDDVD